MSNQKPARSIAEQIANSAYSGGNAEWIEALYEQYLSDPERIPADWKQTFASFTNGHPVSHLAVRQQLKAEAQLPRRRVSTASAKVDHAHVAQAKVHAWIRQFRKAGHREAALDPLQLQAPARLAELDRAFYGLEGMDDQVFDADGLAGLQNLSINDIEAVARKVFCGTIGVEFLHVTDQEERDWLYEHFEQGWYQFSMSAAEKKRLFTELAQAEGLERYLHTRFVGQKRFSLEGGESLIPLMQEVIRLGSAEGLEEVVIGMAHRGRLSTLINIMGKPAGELFAGFDPEYLPASNGSGDVKYHLGYSTDIKTDAGKVHTVLMFNPSHLEIVNPVVLGSVRARQAKRRAFKDNGNLAAIMPLMVHGDAAFSGQGVTQEILQMANTRGFGVGGTLHVICNNQIGFTTANPRDARSSLYASDVAKFIGAPILHVNADDPEAVLFCARFAALYRQTFLRDVLIDLVCYRRNGHNEADEPAATQPKMYKVIRQHPTTLTLYAEQLVEQQVLATSEVDQAKDFYRDQLDAGGNVNDNSLGMVGNEFTADWSRYLQAHPKLKVATHIDEASLSELSAIITKVPADVALHPRVARIMQDRGKMAAGEQACDWGFGETLAYASLLREGYAVRLTGQDSGRGTFFHRHAVLHDQNDNNDNDHDYIPLQHVSTSTYFEVTDSLLSEEAVMGFEYGYACTDPEALVLWEAQFGDFANGAQVIIDQFISSGESKWGRLCGLVLLLPHGQEGQGPEHSSARLERYLQLCAERNMTVAMPTTPAQMFHLLRRQMLWPQRKPLIVMTPKSLLRHPLAVSNLSEFTTGRFETVINETDDINHASATRVVLCSGKVYYELLKQRNEHSLKHVALVRIEQLYPFPGARLKQVLEQYAQAEHVVWCQEEPENQGAWYESRPHVELLLNPKQTLRYAGRARSSAPAPGYPALHAKQQAQLISQALGLVANPE